MIKSAEFSDCGKYRYQLQREWDGSRKIAMVIMLNPSTANSEEDDPTIRTLTRVLAVQGYGGFRVVNLYALIGSKPKCLWETNDPQGMNDHWLQETALLCQDVIYAWGSFEGIKFRAYQVMKMFPDGLCFGKSAKTGMPWHPLALMYNGIRDEDAKLVKF